MPCAYIFLEKLGAQTLSLELPPHRWPMTSPLILGFVVVPPTSTVQRHVHVSEPPTVYTIFSGSHLRMSIYFASCYLVVVVVQKVQHMQRVRILLALAHIIVDDTLSGSKH